MVDPKTLATSLISAYNAKEFDRLEALMAPDLDYAHFTHGLAHNNRDDVLKLLRRSAFEAIPDRAFDPPERITCAGDLAVVELWWSGTTVATMPGVNSAGQKLRVKLCSVLRFNDGGILVEWKDYG
jgi:predicted ester cyclase